MKEALKLALEALEYWDVHGGLNQPTEEAITAIKEALAQQADHSEQHLDMVKAQPAQQEPWCMKMNGCKTKCEDCPVEVVEQEPVNAWLIFGKDNEPLIVSSDWVITKKYKEAGRRVEQLAYYTTPPQPEERNFCSRCGKRTADLTVIHTCTPPQQDQETVFFGVKDQGVKVSSLEFVTRVMGKEEVIGKPIFWAEWPSKEPK